MKCTIQEHAEEYCGTFEIMREKDTKYSCHMGPGKARDIVGQYFHVTAGVLAV